MQAIFRRGNPVMVPYTPVSAVTAGDIIVVGELPMIAHHDIDANVQGELAIGGGVYDILKTAGSSEAITAGANVWWDDSGNVATTTASTHKHLGETAAAAGDDDTTVSVKHNPRPALS